MNTKPTLRLVLWQRIMIVCLRITLACLLLLICLSNKPPETAQATLWPYSTPEAQGMDSNDLLGLLDWIQADNLDVHSILIMRHNTVVMEVYYPPFTPSDKQMQFSATKSFLSAVIGIAQGEGKIGPVTGRMLDYFQDVPNIQNMSAQKKHITLLDLLNMTSGLENCGNYMMKEADPVKAALDKPMAFPPCVKFDYNPCNSVILGEIVEKQTGMGLEAYARQKLFDPLGITDLYWEKYKSGVGQGNIGLMLNPRDMLKFGMLYNQDGVWEGKQIIPKAWIDATYTFNKNGYGYQWWEGLDGLGASGWAGQRIFVFPHSDIIIVCTGDLIEEWQANNIAITPLFAIRSDGSLPPSEASDILAQRIWDIEHPQPQTVPDLPITASAINGKTIKLSENPVGWKTARLDFMGDMAQLTITTDGEIFSAKGKAPRDREKTFLIGLDEIYRRVDRTAVYGLAIPEPPQRYDLNPYEFNILLGLPVDGTVWMKGSWTDEDSFTFTVQDSVDFDRDTVTFNFDPPEVNIDWYSHIEQNNVFTFNGKFK